MKKPAKNLRVRAAGPWLPLSALALAAEGELDAAFGQRFPDGAGIRHGAGQPVEFRHYPGVAFPDGGQGLIKTGAGAGGPEALARPASAYSEAIRCHSTASGIPGVMADRDPARPRHGHGGMKNVRSIGCAYCGTSMEYKATGRPARWCSDPRKYRGLQREAGQRAAAKGETPRQEIVPKDPRPQGSGLGSRPDRADSAIATPTTTGELTQLLDDVRRKIREGEHPVASEPEHVGLYSALTGVLDELKRAQQGGLHQLRLFQLRASSRLQ